MLYYKTCSKKLTQILGGDIMKGQQFDSKEYAKLIHRMEALRSRIELDKGVEQETAKMLLKKIEKKLEAYEQFFKIRNQQAKNYNTTDSFEFEEYDNFMDDNNYYEDTRSEEEMIHDLGILYAIFGGTYQRVLNYHVYRIKFKKQIDREEAFYRVLADIYEDSVRICNNIIIGFWPFHSGDTRCGSMEFSEPSLNSIEKYDNSGTSLYGELMDGLKDIWNFYFDNRNAIPILKNTTLNYSKPNYQETFNCKPEVQLNKEQRKAIIDKTEKEITSVNVEHLEYRTSKIYFSAKKKYQTLNDLLEESGVVYKVENSGVYIWDYDEKEFGKLVGYECGRLFKYCLYLLQNR